MSDSIVTRYGRLILVPAMITLAVTLLRLVGELQEWSSALFNREAGGGWAIVGIVWLIPIFAIYFALRLTREGEGPGKMGRAFALCVLAMAVLPATGFAAVTAGADPTGTTLLLVFVVASVAATFVAFKAWPELGRVLVAYGLAARIPVAIVMLIAIFGDWGTHYDVPPSPDFPHMAPLAKWFWIGLLPQIAIWVAFTVVLGMFFGLTTAAIVRRGQPTTA